MTSVLFVVTNWDALGNTGKKTGWYLPEVAHPYYAFKAANFKMTFCSPKGGLAPMDPSSGEAFKDDEECKKFLNDPEAQELVKNTVAASTIDPSKFNVVFFAGGHGPMFDCADDPYLQPASAKIYEAGGIVSAVCHGPAGLVNIKLSNGEYLVAGKEVTCFTNSEEGAINLCEAMPFLLESKLVERGAKFTKQPDWQPCAVVSERVVTGQNPLSASPMAEKVIALVNSK